MTYQPVQKLTFSSVLCHSMSASKRRPFTNNQHSQHSHNTPTTHPQQNSTHTHTHTHTYIYTYCHTHTYIHTKCNVFCPRCVVVSCKGVSRFLRIFRLTQISAPEVAGFICIVGGLYKRHTHYQLVRILIKRIKLQNFQYQCCFHQTIYVSSMTIGYWMLLLFTFNNI